MSAGSAVQMGSAFVKFFGEASELMKSFREAGTELGKFGKFAKESISEFSSSFNRAEASAQEFGQTTSTALHTVSADFTQTTTAAAGTTNAVAGTASSFQRVNTSAAAAGGGILKAAASFSVFKAGTSAISFIAGNLGGISKAANAASWGLFAVSKMMKQMGYDTTKIDQVKTSFSRISWAAFGANVAVTAVMRTLKAMQTVAMAPITVARGLARIVAGVGQRAGRFGGLGVMGAAAAGSIESGGAETQEGEKAKTSLITPILTGLAVGGPVAAAAMGLGAIFKKAFDAEPATGPLHRALGEIKTRVDSISTAFMQLAKDTIGNAKEAIISFATTGEMDFEKLRAVIFPMADAIRYSFVPSAIEGISKISQMFGMGVVDMQSGWGFFIKDSIYSLVEFVENIDLYFQIAQQNIVLWASNSILQVGDFFANAGEWLSWFGENWFNVLTDVYNISGTIFKNLGGDLKELFTRIWDWVSSGFTSEINFDGLFSNLKDGFQSSIKEWPKLTKTELESMTPELQALYKQLGERQAAATERGETYGVQKEIEQAAEAAKPEGKKGKEFDSAFSAISAQSQDAYSALARIQNASMTGNPQLVESKKQTQKLSEAVTVLKDIAKKDTSGLVEYVLPA